MQSSLRNLTATIVINRGIIACARSLPRCLQADMNVIAVDWRNGAGFPYTQATANIRVVAAELANLLQGILQANAAMAPEDIHMIGHSLGAHAASEVGTRIKRIGRISGR